MGIGASMLRHLDCLRGRRTQTLPQVHNISRADFEEHASVNVRSSKFRENVVRACVQECSCRRPEPRLASD